MMGIEFTFTDNSAKAMKKMASIIEDRLAESANDIRNEVLKTLSGGRSGRTYRIPGTSRDYTASAPGQPPAVQLGDLRKSVKAGVSEEDGEKVGYVGSDLPKAPMLEFGTSNMEARPWLRPSFEKAHSRVKAIMTRTWF